MSLETCKITVVIFIKFQIQTQHLSVTNVGKNLNGEAFLCFSTSCFIKG